LADRGTFLFDETQDLAPDVQLALLAFLEGHGFLPVGGQVRLNPDVRAVVATQRPLEDLAGEGKLRWDLLYRLDQQRLVLLPLRERPEDIVPLARHALAQWAAANGALTARLTRCVIAALTRYRWPGNARELINAMRTAAFEAEGGVIETAHLPAKVLEGDEEVRRDQGSGDMKSRVMRALLACGGTVAEAARLLHRDPRTVRGYVRALGIDLAGIRARARSRRRS
jgi:DNA-binding NtrC family response regulator